MDFFSNIIKTTINKVESTVESYKNPAEQEGTNNEGASGRKKISADGGALIGDINDDVGQEDENIRRVSSGDTYGTDDYNKEQQEMTEGQGEAARKGSTSEELQQRAIESAKSFGNFLFSVGNKVGQTMTATAKQLKQTVEQTGIISDFTKEQQEFIKEHGGKSDVGDAPWVGCDDEANVKEQILQLSDDKRNFVRSPPAGVQFEFDLDSMLPIALTLLKEDPSLNTMRYEIVPKLVNEETFWRNYFYRVSIIKQSTQLGSLTCASSNEPKADWSSSRSSSAEGPDEPGDLSPTGDAEQNEFVSDTFKGNNISDEEYQNGMKQLGMTQDRDDKDALEEELSRDLQEFEFVNGESGIKYDDAELEKELAELDSMK